MNYSNFTLAEVIDTVRNTCREAASSDQEVKEVLKYSLLQLFLTGYLVELKVIKVPLATFDRAADDFLAQTNLSNYMWCCYLLLLIDNTLTDRKIPAADFSGFLTTQVAAFARIQFKRPTTPAPAATPSPTPTSALLVAQAAPVTVKQVTNPAPKPMTEVETVKVVFALPGQDDTVFAREVLFAEQQMRPYDGYPIGHAFYDEIIAAPAPDYSLRYQIINSEAGVVGVVSLYFKHVICAAVTTCSFNQPVIIAKDAGASVRFCVTLTY